MEPGAEKPPSSDEPSPKIKTVSLESEQVGLPERSSAWSFPILKEYQEILRRLKTRMLAENQPDRSHNDTTSSDSAAPQSETGCYHQDGGESSQTSSVRRLTSRRSMAHSSVDPSRFFGGTPFNFRPASKVPLVPLVPLSPLRRHEALVKAPLSCRTASTSSDSRISESISSCSVSSRPVPTPTVIHEQGPLSPSCFDDIFSWISDPPNTLHLAEWYLTPPPTGCSDVPESQSTYLNSTQSARYSDLYHPVDPEDDSWTEMFHKDPVYNPLTPESTEIRCLQLPPASPKESNPSSAADAVPSATLKNLEFSSEEDLSFLPNWNRTDDADSSSPMSILGSRDTEFYSSTLSGNASGAGSDYQLEMEASAPDLTFLPASLPPSSDTRLRKSKRNSGCLTRCVSAPSLSEIPPLMAPHLTVTQAKSLPNMHSRGSFEDFTPEITVELNEETFWFRCSCPGLYQCSVTGLVFRMAGDGVVVYRVVPWNRRLLAQHHKQPAGPLFDIKCEQQSVRQLYLPHCEIYSTDRCHFLSVAHVEDEGIEFIAPQKVTETHIIINIARFSAFGIVKDEESPPEPVRALVLLFYRPPSSSDNSSLLNVLLLPRNVVLRNVQHTRKKLVGDEIYIETFSRCKLRPNEEYTLSTCPADDTVLVEPAEAEFDSDNYDNYIPSFQVSLETAMKHMELFLKDSSQRNVWEKRVCLSVSAVNQRPSGRDGPSHERLMDVRIGLIGRISGPVLKGLLDKLFEKKVIADSEREEADGIQNRGDRARFVIDTVRRKGEAASSEMIKILCDDDPYLCENLGLI